MVPNKNTLTKLGTVTKLLEKAKADNNNNKQNEKRKCTTLLQKRSSPS